MKMVFRSTAILAIVACSVQFVNADKFYYNHAGATAAQNWEDSAIWTPDAGNTSGRTFPNAEGDVVIFNSLATANNPAQTANHTVNLNVGAANDKTVGAIISNLDGSTTGRNNIQQGDGGSLIMDGAGATNATIDHYNSATAMGITNFTAPMVLNDQLQLTIHNTSNRADGLSLRLQGNISGSGGLTRLGVSSSLLTMIPLSGNSYTYTGPTILDGGRTQITPAGAPTASSSFTVQNTAQLEPNVTGTYQFGAANAPLILNSDGTGNGGNLGTIRPTRLTTGPTQVTITNSSVVLQAPLTIIHSEGVTSNGSDPTFGYIELDGVVSGGASNKLQLTTTSHSQNHGTYVLTGANTYSGGTDVYAGRLSTDFLTDGGLFNSATVTAHPTATFGTGDIHVFATPSNVALAVARMTIPSGVLNAIGDSATLSLDGNADWGRSAFAELGDGINELVGHLVLGGVTQTDPGTYGSSTSGATHVFDTYFTGNGVISIAASSLPGDYNGNGIVDAADYVLWRKSPGTYGGDPAGYNTWRASFGNTSPGSGSGLGSASVPEPSTFLLITMAIAPLATNRRRRFA